MLEEATPLTAKSNRPQLVWLGLSKTTKLVSMCPPHPASLSAEKLLAACDTRRLRRSGPGGQHRNKVETAVVLTHRPTGISAQASERRSQSANQRRALFRLRIELALHVRRPLDSTEQGHPSGRWQTRIRGGRISVNTGHEDFPALVAEALDILDAAEFDFSAAAHQLQVTSSQLGKFLKLEPAVWQLVSAERQKRGLRPLK